MPFENMLTEQIKLGSKIFLSLKFCIWIVSMVEVSFEKNHNDSDHRLGVIGVFHKKKIVQDLLKSFELVCILKM